MKKFIKIFALFIYFFLALFTWQGSISACENITAQTSIRYITSLKPETILLNNKKEEYFVISQRNKTEIENLSNKNNNFGFNGFDKINIYFSNNFIKENTLSPIFVSYNNSFNLKNTIYTRAP